MFKRLFGTTTNIDDVDVANVTSNEACDAFVSAVQTAITNDKYVLPRKTESKLFLDCNDVDVVTGGLKVLAGFAGVRREFAFHVTDGKTTTKYLYHGNIIDNVVIVKTTEKYYTKTMTSTTPRESFTQIAPGEPCETVTVQQLVAPGNQLFVHTELFKSLHRENMYQFKELEAFRWNKTVDYDRLDFRRMFLDVFNYDDSNIITVCNYTLVNPINMAAFIARDSVGLNQCVSQEFLFVRAIFIREFIKYYTVNVRPKYCNNDKVYINNCGTVSVSNCGVNMHSEEKLLNMIHRDVPYC